MIFWGGSRWSCPKKFREKKLRLKLNNSTQKLDFDVLWLFEKKSVQNLGRKKRKKKRNEPHCSQKWVGWDERVS